MLKTTYAYYLSFVSLGLMMAALGPTLPDLADQTDASLSEIGILFTVRSVGALAGTLLVGRLFDRQPGHPLMAAALILMSVMLALTPLVPLLGVFILIFLLLGIAESGINVGGNTLIVWVHGKAVGPYMNGLHFFFGAGSVLCPMIIAETVRQTDGITAGYWILALLMLPAALWLYRLPSPLDQSRTQENLPPANPRLVLWIALFFFFLASGNYTFGGWIYTYALKMDLADKTSAAYINSAYLGAVTVARLIGIPLALRFRPATMILASLGGMFLSACFLMVFQTTLALWMGVITTGLSAATVFPSMMAYAGGRLNLTAHVTSWFIVGVNLGGVFLPYLVGYFFDNGHAAWMMSMVALNLVVVMGIFLWLHFYAEQPIAETSRA